MKIIEKLKKYLKESNEIHKRREESNASVNCPFCDIHYSTQEISEYEREVEIEGISMIRCYGCSGIFGVKTITYYEPYMSMFKKSIKIWRR